MLSAVTSFDVILLGEGVTCPKSREVSGSRRVFAAYNGIVTHRSLRLYIKTVSDYFESPKRLNIIRFLFEQLDRV